MLVCSHVERSCQPETAHPQRDPSGRRRPDPHRPRRDHARRSPRPRWSPRPPPTGTSRTCPACWPKPWPARCPRRPTPGQARRFNRPGRTHRRRDRSAAAPRARLPGRGPSHDRRHHHPPATAQTRPGLRFGLIDHALSPTGRHRGPGTTQERPGRGGQRRGLFSLTDLRGLDPRPPSPAPSTPRPPSPGPRSRLIALTNRDAGGAGSSIDRGRTGPG